MRDEQLTFTSKTGHRDGTLILSLTGPLTLANLFSFQEEFRALKPQVLIVDLSDSPYMDSAGLGLLVNYYVSAEREARKLYLVGVNSRIEALLSLTKLDQILKTFPSTQEAEAKL